MDVETKANADRQKGCKSESIKTRYNERKQSNQQIKFMRHKGIQIEQGHKMTTNLKAKDKI